MEWSTLGKPGRALPGRFQLRGFRFRWLYVCAACAILLGCVTFAGYAWALKTVTLVVDGRETAVETRGRTVSEVLADAGVRPGPRDRVVPAPDTELQDGMRVVVSRAVPVIVRVEGRKLEGFTYGKTVREALDGQKITLGALDIVQPALDQPVHAGMNIRVIRVREEKKLIRVPLPFDVQKEPDSALDRGESAVVQAGLQGKEEQRWVLVYHDGREVNRIMEDSRVIVPPRDEIIRVGTRQQVSRGGDDIRFTRVLDMVATAYSYTGNSTASGVPPRRGVVAVDPRVIPLGTRLYVEGYGYATALDCGSGISGRRIDLFMESQAQAGSWGVRRVRVYVLD